MVQNIWVGLAYHVLCLDVSDIRLYGSLEIFYSLHFHHVQFALKSGVKLG